MIILGVILVVLAWLIDLGPLDNIAYAIGVILIIVGVLFFILGVAGRPVGGRRYWL